MVRTFAYCRVSTVDQTTANQVQEIAGPASTWTPAGWLPRPSAAVSRPLLRPAFAKLMDRLEEGDVLIVTKLDRLGRDTIDVVSTVDRLAKMGCGCTALHWVALI